jgi:hypothetical protein
MESGLRFAAVTQPWRGSVSAIRRVTEVRRTPNISPRNSCVNLHSVTIFLRILLAHWNAAEFQSERAYRVGK